MDVAASAAVAAAAATAAAAAGAAASWSSHSLCSRCRRCQATCYMYLPLISMAVVAVRTREGRQLCTPLEGVGPPPAFGARTGWCPEPWLQ